MTRAQLRGWLRRRLQETSATIWQDDVLNLYINEGLHELAAALALAEPEFALFTDVRDIEVDKELYQVPSNCDRVIEVWFKGPGETDYFQLDYRRRRDQNNSDHRHFDSFTGENFDQPRRSSVVSYGIQGQFIRIHPTPETDIDDGLRLVYVPIVSLAEDAESPPIAANIQRGAVLAAQLYAYGDTAESTDKAAVQEELNMVLNRIKSTYDRNADNDELLTFPSNLRITSQDVL